MGKAMQLDFPPTLTQFIKSNKRQRWIRGPIGSGKSVACATELLIRAKQQAPASDGIRYTRMVICRNTLQQLKTTCLPTIRTVIDPIMHWKVSDSTIQIRVDDIHSDWILLPLDTEANVQRLLSLEITMGWASEFRELRPDLLRALMSRCGRYPSKMDVGPTFYGTIAETNSFSEDSPYFEELEKPALADELPTTWGYFVQPSGLSPEAENIDNLPDDYYKDMVESNPTPWVEQYVENKITPSLSGQAVFKHSFDGGFHISQGELIPSRGHTVIIGLDTGRNPAGVIGQINHTGVLQILGQAWAANMGMKRFLREILTPMMQTERFAGLPCFCCVDPAGLARSQIGEQSVIDAIKAEGFTALPAQTNNIEPRLRAVDNWLIKAMPGGKPAIVFDQVHCGPLIGDMRSGYRFKIKKDGEMEDKPDKKHPESDRSDALQYLCLGTAKNVLGRAMRRGSIDAASEPSSGGWT